MERVGDGKLNAIQADNGAPALSAMDDPARRYTVDLLKSPLMAFAASVTDPHQFRSGRQFAAWLGLTPLQHSSGGKERLGRISATNICAGCLSSA